MTTAIQLTGFSTSNLPQPGDTVDYFIYVRNTGAHVIDSLTFTSTLPITYIGITADGTLSPGPNGGDDNANGLLDPNETWYYYGGYTFTAPPGSSTVLLNSTTVTATGPGGSVAQFTTISVPLGAETPAIEITQSGAPSPAKAGDVVTYNIGVRNSGNITFFGLTLDSSPFGPATAVTGAGGFNTGDLDKDGNFDVGETWSYTATHTVSQADIANQGAIDGSVDGFLTNTVRARAYLCGEGCPDFTEATNSASVKLDEKPLPAADVLLVKTARVDSDPCGCHDECISGRFGVGNDTRPAQTGIQPSAGINLGDLTKYLFVFADGRTDANWQGATKGFSGDVVVDGLQAKERTSGGVPYAGTLYTNDSTGGAWKSIVDQNAGQATLVTNQTSLVSKLEQDLVAAIKDIGALTATPTASFGGKSYNFASLASTTLNGLNTTDGVAQTFVINVTSGLGVNSKINISGDAGDVFVLRWDTDANAANGFQGQVKFQSGGGIVPGGGLGVGNFIHVAGDINSSGGGSNPADPYPQAPTLADGTIIKGGAKFSGGGFFTGYWLTTGAPSTTRDSVTGLFTGPTASLSNGIFAGGWYSLTTKFSMTSGTSGMHVCPNPCLITPNDPIQQTDSPFDPGNVGNDGSTVTGFEKDVVTYSFRITNTGQRSLNNVLLRDDNATPSNPDDDYTPTAVLQTNGFNFGDVNNNNLIDSGESWYYQSKRVILPGSSTLTNTATVTATPVGIGGSVSDTDIAIVQVF
jgi:uncharacterized repeat protein (TIGR01451 family)